MKVFELIALGWIVVILSSPQALAGGTAEELLKECEAASTGSYCEGYIAGFYDGRTTSDYGKPDLMSCPPTDGTGQNLAVSYRQMVLVFIKWAKDHPEKLHYSDWQAVRQALAEAWPCPRAH
jgi:hypothetical protein